MKSKYDFYIKSTILTLMSKYEIRRAVSIGIFIIGVTLLLAIPENKKTDSLYIVISAIVMLSSFIAGVYYTKKISKLSRLYYLLSKELSRLEKNAFLTKNATDIIVDIICKYLKTNRKIVQLMLEKHKIDTLLRAI